MSYEGFLTQMGFIVPVCTVRARLGAQYSNLLSKLTIVHHQKVGPPKFAKMYKLADYNGIQCIHLPRTLISLFVRNKILDKINVLLPQPTRIDTKLQIDLYNNQTLIINHLCQKVFTEARIADGTAAAILNLRAGMGKTFVAGGLISRLGMRTLYVVPKRPLALQAVKDLRTCLYPDDIEPPLSVGLFGKKIIKRDKSSDVGKQAVTVIVINSALDRTSEFFSGYSCIILDEVHLYCSEQRREIFRKATGVIVLGMSATTEDRSDGFDPIAHKELAFDGIIRAEDIPGFDYENVEFDCHARVINYSGPPEYTKNLTHEATGRVFTHYMYNQYISDPYRLQLAVNELISLYDWRGQLGEKHYVYVFAEELDILKKAREAFIAALKLRADIVEDIIAPECELEMFTGGLKDEKIVEITKNCRVLFSTYSFAGTGLSITKMSAMLFLTPRKSNMKQILARILRRGSDIKIPRIVVDIVDKRTALKYQLGSRKVAYEQYDFQCEETQVKFNDIVILRKN